MRKAPLQNRLGLEHLEGRQLMAGNVVAYVDQGDLVVSGDSNHNGVQLRQVNANTFAVGGFTHGGVPTTVNGKSGWVTFSGITDDVLLNGGSGNDYLYVAGTPTSRLNVNDVLQVNGNSGNDILFVESANAQMIYMEGGFEADQLYAKNVWAKKELSLHTDASYGTDRFNDYVAVYGNSRVGSVGQAGMLWIYGNDGADQAFVHDTQTDYLFAILRDGNDYLSLKNSTVNIDTAVHGGNGYDTLNRHNFRYRTARIDVAMDAFLEKYMANSRY